MGTVEDTHHLMVSHVTSSITDRASVNLKTLVVLQERWQTTIITTFCHLHPLETLSRNALSCLKQYETYSFEKLYAGTSLGDKLLLAIDKWRYSDSSGEPKTSLAFMKEDQQHQPGNLGPVKRKPPPCKAQKCRGLYPLQE